MDRSQLNMAKNLVYRNPAVALRELRAIEIDIAGLDLPPEVKHLRTNDLKNVKEYRHAALFCYGMSKRMGTDIRFCPMEDSDYDFIATWQFGLDRHFATVQLKEFVPEELNPDLAVQNLIDRLSKYPASENLTVVIVLNRNSSFIASELVIPKLNIAALWLIASISEDQSQWRIFGNLMDSPSLSDFEYPA